jgi:hypothetical protein
MSGSSEGAEPSDEALLAQVRRTAHLKVTAKLAFGANNFFALQRNQLGCGPFPAIVRGLRPDGDWSDMAVRGAFAVRRYASVASVVRHLRLSAVCVSRNGKSRRRHPSVYNPNPDTSFAVKSPNANEQCLILGRAPALRVDEALLERFELGRKPAMCDVRVTHLSRRIGIRRPVIRPRAEGKPSAKGKRGLLI